MSKKLIFWRFIFSVSVAFFLGGVIYRGHTDFAFLLGMAILYSLLIFRAFLLDIPMHLWGFHLDPENVVLRIYFLIFGILVWVISFAILFGYME